MVDPSTGSRSPPLSSRGSAKRSTRSWALPEHEPYEAWANFEFLDASGRLYDVDLMLCGPKGVFVVEVKSWPGELTGDDHTLVWTDPEGRRPQARPSAAAHKPEGEGTQVAARGDARGPAFDGRLPYFNAAVFLSDPEPSGSARRARAHRDRTGARRRTPSRDRGSVTSSLSLVEVSSREHAQPQARPARRPADGGGARAGYGAGGYPPIEPVADCRRLSARGAALRRPGFQDFAARTRRSRSRRRRIRIYAAPQTAADPRREQLRRAARREHELLEGLHHQGILRPQDFVEHDLGPALVLDAEPDWPSLDQWLAENAERLSLADRLDLIRQIADTVAYAHSHGLVHRALSPRAILVVPDIGEPQRIRIGDWRTGRYRGGGPRRDDRRHPERRGPRRPADRTLPGA